MRIIGIGTDITECVRIEQMLEKHGSHFLDHVYTEHEIGYSSNKKRSAEHFAVRWAAKEAVLKALGTGWITGTSWKDVEVRNEPSGRPVIKLYAGTKKLAESLGVTEILISLSHCSTHAVANAIAIMS
ncbi:MAG: holo-ACP synthase [Thermoguttaceae bacterium]